MKLQDKVAIVTGAASGMGKAIAMLFALEGAKVAVSDLNLDGAKETVKEIEANGGTAFAIQTNVVSEEDVNELVDKTVEMFGTVDVLVNNAGIMDGFEPIGEISNDKFDKVMAVNAKSIMFTSRKVIPVFLEKGKGVIVNNASAAGVHGGRGGAGYTASKHAAIGLTKNTAFMYAQKGIRANAIATGAVETNIAQSMTNISEFGAARQGLGLQLNPRLGKPEDIAKVALFLASEDSDFVNGAVIAADAGWTAY